MIEISDLQCGKAGEYLVCADLILSGFVAFPSEQGLPFDIVADVGSRLIKIQVKTTRTVKQIPQRPEHNQGYLFHVKRMGKNGSKQYSENEVDIFALVALDSREIGYIAASNVKQTMIFRSTNIEGRYIDEIHSARAKNIKELREKGLTFSQISKQVGVDKSFANRVCTGKSGQPRESRYLRDFRFTDALKSIGIINETH